MCVLCVLSLLVKGFLNFHAEGPKYDEPFVRDTLFFLKFISIFLFKETFKLLDKH